MMTTSNLNIRLDDTLRSQATEVLASYGLSPTQAIKLFFSQVVATKTVPLSFDYQASRELELTDKVLMILEQNRQDQLQGCGVTRYTSADELMSGLSDEPR